LNDLTVVSSFEALPAIISRAANMLDEARTSAEVLDARDAARFAYDAAKSAARLRRAKGAHDDLVLAAHRLQGDALKIEARAKYRLAEEYDAAQERGEVASGRPKSLPEENSFTATTADLGLTSKDIFEARQVRDAEKASPGIVGAAVDAIIAAGEEPTRAAVNRAVTGGFLSNANFSGNNEWYTPDEFLDLAREVMGAIDLDPASCEAAQARVAAAAYFTEEDDGLTKDWNGRVWLNPPYAQPLIGQFVDKLTSEIEAGRVTEAILLTNSATDTSWFHEAAEASKSICFTRGRLRFVPADPSREANSPAQGQAFFYFGHRPDTFAVVFGDVGFVAEVRR
jgi:phage N-6-adenine-methyltransferase